MELDECDYYEIKKNSRFCKHFTGSITNCNHITNCKFYCLFNESQDCMKHDAYKRVQGAIQQRR